MAGSRSDLRRDERVGVPKPPQHPRFVSPSKPSANHAHNCRLSTLAAARPLRPVRSVIGGGSEAASRGSSTPTAPHCCTLSCSSHPHMAWVTGPHPTLSPPADGSSSTAAVCAWIIPRYTASMNRSPARSASLSGRDGVSSAINLQRCCSAHSIRPPPPRDIHVDAAIEPVVLVPSASNRGRADAQGSPLA